MKLVLLLIVEISCQKQILIHGIVIKQKLRNTTTENFTLNFKSLDQIDLKYKAILMIHFILFYNKFNQRANAGA